jgi:hypothetical protein
MAMGLAVPREVRVVVEQKTVGQGKLMSSMLEYTRIRMEAALQPGVVVPVVR